MKDANDLQAKELQQKDDQIKNLAAKLKMAQVPVVPVVTA